MHIRQRSALVTGGASGIGLGIAAELVERGARVCIADLRADALESAARAVASTGGSVLAFTVDVADRASYRRMAAQAEQALSGIDILVNNAGVGYSGVPLYEVPDADVDWVLDVNVRGVMNGIRVFVPAMVRRGSGHVVNVASMSGLGLPPGVNHGLYGASKAAVAFLSEGLRQDLAGTGVGVTLVCPGYVRSNLPNSGSYRGERYGGARDVRASPAILAAMERAMDPRRAAAFVADAIERDEFLVLTDLAEAGDVEAWHRQVVEAMGQTARRP